MKETGRISDIRGRMVTVLGGEIAACFGCMNQECKSNRRVITAENRRHLELSPGQFVEVENSTTGAFVQFLQAMLPLLAGFIIGYLITWLGFPGSGDGVRTAVGFAGLFLTGFGVYMYRRKFPVKNNPEVTKILDEPGFENCDSSFESP